MTEAELVRRLHLLVEAYESHIEMHAELCGEMSAIFAEAGQDNREFTAAAHRVATDARALAAMALDGVPAPAGVAS